MNIFLKFSLVSFFSFTLFFDNFTCIFTPAARYWYHTVYSYMHHSVSWGAVH